MDEIYYLDLLILEEGNRLIFAAVTDIHFGGNHELKRESNKAKTHLNFLALCSKGTDGSPDGKIFRNVGVHGDQQFFQLQVTMDTYNTKFNLKGGIYQPLITLLEQKATTNNSQ